MTTKNSSTKMTLAKKLALTSTCLVALCGAPALAQTAVAPKTGTAPTAKPAPDVVRPFYGDIDPFYGDIDPFYGDIDPFYGDIDPFFGAVNPFYGDIDPFYGDIDPFVSTSAAASKSTITSYYGTTSNAFWGTGNANPFVKNPSPFVQFSQIKPFWTAQKASWMALQASWSQAKTTADYTKLAASLKAQILDPAAKFWGPAIANAVTTGAIKQDFGAAALARSGIKFNTDGTINAASLAGMTPTERMVLFQDYYDGLMTFSGAPRVDWWMGATGWSPALAQIATSAASGKKSTIGIGMLDFTATATATGQSKNPKGSLLQYGSSVFGNGHGAAVASLIMGSADGANITGVMPTGTATVSVYDPYDATGTTNWTDVGKGIDQLTTAVLKKGGSGKIDDKAPQSGVLNASLGVQGWTLNPGWNTALASGLAANRNLVIAAGNDGVSQSTNVAWNFAKNPTLIVVGSIGASGQVSNFSNRPGEACLVDAATNVCTEANKLKYNFVYAPGELILVSDGEGGIARKTGTSLAAPLVSGAIAMLQARWPWLGNYSKETAKIILDSAAPFAGIKKGDPVYGMGKLDIEASQSPLSWSNLKYYTVTKSSQTPTAITATAAATMLKAGTQASFNASGLYLTAIETIGATHRDFQIPMASTLIGQTTKTEAGDQLFQSYLATPLRTWMGAGAKFTGATDTRALLGFSSGGAPAGRMMGMNMTVNMAPAEQVMGFKQSSPFDTEFALTGETHAFRFGFGQGAAALSGQPGLGFSNDYKVNRGGANPLLGLASGGAFADWRVNVADRLAVSAGITTRRDRRDTFTFGILDQRSDAVIYQAKASHLGLDYAVGTGLMLHASVTQLREKSGLLGMQSLSSALADGSTTTGGTFGADVALPLKLSLSASATMSKTKTGDNQALTTGPGGLRGSSAAVALNRTGLFSKQDGLRVTAAKSMQVTGGELHYADYGVVDRNTGELGYTDQVIRPAADKGRYSVEMMYGVVLKNAAEFSLFVRGETGGLVGDTINPYGYVGGAKYKIAF